MSALLPCPFCGEGADLMELFEGFCGECGNCETTGPAAETEAAAIAAWNQRATPAEVEKLRADVERLREALTDIAMCRIPHVPDGVTVGMEQFGPFAQQRARAALAKEPGDEG